MRINRLQITLIFTCIFAFGMSIEFLWDGVSTVMPFWFLICLVILGITFIPGIGNAWSHVRSGIRHASPHVGNFGNIIGSNIRLFGQKVWVWVKQTVQEVSPHVKSWFKELLDASGEYIKVFAKARWNTMQQAPSFWCGVACLIMAGFLFLYAYLKTSYGASFHSGLAMTFASAVFFINHVGWNIAEDFVKKWKKEVFLATSCAWLALAYVHNWSLLWPGITTAIAMITFFWLSRTDQKKEMIIEAAKKKGDKLLMLLNGGYGPGISLLIYAAAILVFAGPTLMQANPLTGERLDIGYNFAIVFVFFLIAGVILTGEKLVNKKEKE